MPRSTLASPLIAVALIAFTGGQALAADCLEQDVIEAIQELDTGTVPTDPSQAEVADALDTLDLVGSQDEARDRLVRNLRFEPEYEMDLALAAAIFQSEVSMEECAEQSPIERAESSEGQWVYEGTWTTESVVTEYPGETEIPEPRPGTLVIVCQPGVSTCVLEGLGSPAPPGSIEIVDAGLLQREPSVIEDDTCPGGRTRTETVEVEHGPETAVVTVRQTMDPLTCETDDGGTSWGYDYIWVFRGELTSFLAPEAPEAPEEPDEQPGESGTPSPSGEPGTGGPLSGGSAERPFAASVPKLAEVSTDPVVLLQSAALAALLVFLMPFPSQLFNSTFETHEDEVRRWLRLDRIGSAVGRLGAFWGSWPGVAVFTMLAAVLYGFLDPGFGFSVGSLATFLGMLVGIVLVTAAFAVPVVLAHRRLGDRWRLKVVPVSLLIGVACVVLSRLTGFQPGYLYGLLIGLAFARELSAAEEGRATAIGAVVMLAVAFAAWLGLGAMPEGEGFALVVLRTSLAALMVAGLEGVVFGLLPMRFLPGEPLYAWNRILWGTLLAVGAFAFFHILINPASGYLSDSSRTPLFTVIAMLAGFSLVSVAFWAWFRFRSGTPADEKMPA